MGAKNKGIGKMEELLNGSANWEKLIGLEPSFWGIGKKNAKPSPILLTTKFRAQEGPQLKGPNQVWNLSLKSQ